MSGTSSVARARAHDVLVELLQRTARWPKRLRAGVTSRVEAEAVGVVAELAAADAARGRARLRRLYLADAHLESLRSLLRVAGDLRIVSAGGVRHLVAHVDEVGRLLGGWLRVAGRG